MPDTTTRLRALIATQFGIDEALIRPDASFADDLGGDSLDSIEFPLYLEEEFCVEISDDEADAALGPDGTFGKLLALVERKVGEVARV